MNLVTKTRIQNIYTIKRLLNKKGIAFVICLNRMGMFLLEKLTLSSHHGLLEDLFSTSSSVGRDEAIQGIKPVVIDSMNSILDDDLTIEKAECALFQMHATKVPNPIIFMLFFIKSSRIS